MNCELNLRTIYFSATGTSKKVALAVSQSIATDFVVEDVTFQSLQNATFAVDDLLCVAVPVYGGGVAPVALKRLDAIRGNNTPVVVVVVYGNRNFERAAMQMSDFLSERGFITIAAAAFVGEHSYSTEQYPIAVGRPLVEDTNDAKHFGQLVKEKLAVGIAPVDVAILHSFVVQNAGIIPKLVGEDNITEIWDWTSRRVHIGLRYCTIFEMA